LFLIQKSLNMNKLLLSFIFSLYTLFNFAHGTDASILILKEHDDNTWTLQTKSSLEAFRKEIRMHFSETPYTSPEMFKEQVLTYFKNTFKITVNNTEIIPLNTGVVKLGHETSLFFNKIKLPKNINSIKIEGGMFKDIYKSNAKLLILKKGFDKTPFILSKKNNFTVNLSLKEQKITLIPQTKQTSHNSYVFFIGLFITVIGIALLFLIKKYVSKNKISEKIIME